MAETTITTDAADNARKWIEVYRKKRWSNLELTGLGLTTLPPEICQLTTLTTLNLAGNKLTLFPPEISQLTALTWLNLESNELTTLPPEIGQLTALTTLLLHNNELTTLPPQIGQLTALTKLDLSGNELTTLPPVIAELMALTELYLNNNELTTLPSKIGQLTALTRLYVESNELTTLPPEIGQLTALTTLGLDGNQLTTLPPEIGQLKGLKGLYLHDNPPLGIPLEVLGPTREQVSRQGAEPKPACEILEYYFTHRMAAEKGGTEPLMEAKILVLGEASVGKTCLIAALSEGKKRQELDGKGTSGIVRKLWPVKIQGNALAPKPRSRGAETLRLNCWDFGGQEIYHSAHTLFLTHRAIYLIVISKRDNERQNNIDYWLRMATSFGGVHAVVYVVVNKDDEKVGHAPDEEALRRKYPQIRGFLRTSCDDLTGIAGGTRDDRARCPATGGGAVAGGQKLAGDQEETGKDEGAYPLLAAMGQAVRKGSGKRGRSTRVASPLRPPRHGAILSHQPTGGEEAGCTGTVPDDHFESRMGHAGHLCTVR
jgi:internalin A